jgi:hypothetical protein
MNEKQKAALIQYILAKNDRLDSDIEQLQQHIRYRDIDPVDCLEMLLAAERKIFFKAITGELLALLRVFR